LLPCCSPVHLLLLVTHLLTLLLPLLLLLLLLLRLLGAVCQPSGWRHVP
jgi:hypothetical protein